MSKWGFGYAFDMELDTPLDFFDVTYKNGKKVRYDKRLPGEWIPCSERLPEPNKEVLVCSDEGYIEVAEGYISTEIEEFMWLTSGWRFGEVIAWMPLPEPYKRGEVND